MGPHAGASRRWMTLERMSSNLIVATRSPTQIEFISLAGCAHTWVRVRARVRARVRVRVRVRVTVRG